MKRTSKRAPAKRRDRNKAAARKRNTKRGERNDRALTDDQVALLNMLDARHQRNAKPLTRENDPIAS